MACAASGRCPTVVIYWERTKGAKFFISTRAASSMYLLTVREATSTPEQFPTEQSAEGEFERQEDAYRHLVTADGSSPFPAAVGRYHLYISLACPWASRTLVVRKLKGLH